MDLMIGIVAVGDPTWGFLESMLKVEYKAGEYLFALEQNVGLSVARNRIVRRFLASPAKWLFMVDKDALFLGGTVTRLMNWNVDVAGVLYFTRRKPTVPVCYSGWVDGYARCTIMIEEVLEWLGGHPELYTNGAVLLDPVPPKSLRQVDATGCHGLLVKRDVFEKIPPPWFMDALDHGVAGEDFYFFRLLREHGIPAYVDFSTVAGHMEGSLSAGALDFLAWNSVCDWNAGTLKPEFQPAKNTGG